MYEIKDLTSDQVDDIEKRIDEYDNKFLPKPLDMDIFRLVHLIMES